MLERLGHEPVGVHLGVHDVDLIGLEDPECPDIGRRLADDDVAGVAEDAGDQVDRLLGADRHDHVVGVRLDALEAHDVADLLAQPRVTLAGAVLQGDLALGGDELGERLAHDVHGEP